jgi:cephalosporin-C deacetylase
MVLLQEDHLGRIFKTVIERIQPDLAEGRFGCILCSQTHHYFDHSRQGLMAQISPLADKIGAHQKPNLTEDPMPLTFDLPLEQLYTYHGSTPKPADFNAFWDQSLAEMQALDPQIELRPADFSSAIADGYHLYFTGVSGARVHARLLKPKHTGKSPSPAVLMFHGYYGQSDDWSTKLPYVSEGFVVAALDCRGQAGLSEDVGGVDGYTLRGHIVRGLEGPPEKMLFRQIFLDTAQLAKIVMDMPEVDETRVAAMGMSQGGGLTLACASLTPEIKLALPVFPFLCDYQRVWEIDLANEDAYWELGEYFRRFDPTHDRQEAIFQKLGYIDVQNLTARIQAETHLTVCLMDMICPPSTQFAAYNKITAPKSLRIYPDFGHELPSGHADYEFRLLKERL